MDCIQIHNVQIGSLICRPVIQPACKIHLDKLIETAVFYPNPFVKPVINPVRRHIRYKGPADKEQDKAHRKQNAQYTDQFYFFRWDKKNANCPGGQ